MLGNLDHLKGSRIVQKSNRPSVTAAGRLKYKQMRVA